MSHRAVMTPRERCGGTSDSQFDPDPAAKSRPISSHPGFSETQHGELAEHSRLRQLLEQATSQLQNTRDGFVPGVG